jgi:DNA-binding beta-propeller fold protein YncE
VRRLIVLLLLVLLVGSDPAPAKRARKKCRKLCRGTIAECIASTCDPLAKRKARRRCKAQCKRQTLAACRKDEDRTRCVPTTTTTVPTTETTTTTTTTIPPPSEPFSGPTVPIAVADNDAYLVNVNPDANTVTVFDHLSSPVKLAEIPVGRGPVSVAIHPTSSKLYVASTGASPNGPLRFNTMAQGLVSVVDRTTGLEVTAAQTDPTVRRTAPLNLNQGINLATTPAPRLFLTNPAAMVWRPDGSDAWIAVQNTDLVVRLTADGAGIPTVAAPLVAGPSAIVRVDLESVGPSDIPGLAPRGLAVNKAGTLLYVSNFASRSVTTVDITNPTAPVIVATARSTALPIDGSADAVALEGAELFFTGRGPQGRMSNEGWGGCIVCHPDGRSDNVTWMFDAGPRQTIPLDGTFNHADPADQRVLNWSAVRDENHDFELNTRGVFGGRGLIEDDRLVLAIGGASGATPTDSPLVEQFEQFTGAVGTTNDLAGGAALPTLASVTARRDFAVAALDDDRVFILGGRTGAGGGSLVPALDATLELNPRTNSLTRLSSTGFLLSQLI